MKPLRRVVCLALAALALNNLQPETAFAGGEGGNPAAKLTRGIVNFSTGWLEVPNQMVEQKKTDPTKVWWFLHGLIRGVMAGTTRMLYGAYDIITFPVAPYNAPIMTPDTLIALQKPSRESKPTPPPPKP